jgi:hypothetical protein
MRFSYRTELRRRAKHSHDKLNTDWVFKIIKARLTLT